MTRKRQRRDAFGRFLPAEGLPAFSEVPLRDPKTGRFIRRQETADTIIATDVPENILGDYPPPGTQLDATRESEPKRNRNIDDETQPERYSDDEAIQGAMEALAAFGYKARRVQDENSKDLRKPFDYIEDAVSYMDEIPVPTVVLVDDQGLFRVLVIGSDPEMYKEYFE